MIKPHMRRWFERFAPLALPLIDDTSPGLPAPRSELLQFLDLYDDVVAAILEQVHEHPSEDTSSRYLILKPVGAPTSYVQCAFDEGDLSLLCEAASGYFAEPGCGPSFSAEQKLALGRLSFSTDGSAGNFAQHLHFDYEPDFDAISHLLLETLYRAYGSKIVGKRRWRGHAVCCPRPMK